MSLVICGIDEAGYGPMLGPLCVAACMVRLDRWSSGDSTPDLWATLDSAVCRAPRDKRRRIAVADSKRLKLANQSKTKHPLTHLERGVLCHLAAAGWSPRTDTDLFAALDTALGHEPWFAGDPIPIPLANDIPQLDIDANLLRGAMARGGVLPVDLAVEAIAVDRFNAILAEGGTKSDTTRVAIIALFRRAVTRWLANADGSSLRLVCDRQGGRQHYAPLVREAFPKSLVETVSEQPAASVYRVEIPNAKGDVRVLFQPEAEDAHLPVAMASMAAKLVRELAMARFNRYWAARVEGLKPTAGYIQDARRWLDDARDALTAEDRTRLIRRA